MIIEINTKKPEPALIEKAWQYLVKGEIIAFPSDSVMGILALHSNHLKLHNLRERNLKKPFLLIIGEAPIHSVFEKFSIPEKIDTEGEKMIQKAWPGKTTFVMPKNRQLKYPTGTSIALRMPSENPALLSLLSKTKEALLAPSANLPGTSPLTNPVEIKKTFPELVAIFTDPKWKQSNPSSIYDITKYPIQKLR